MKKILVLFLVFTFANSIMGQNMPNDCVNAIVVCGNGNFSSNSNGIGSIQEVSGCGGQEHNSIWIKINIVQSGTLGFDLIPDNTNITVDYDFWIFGPNKACSNLGSPIRCATTNPQLAGMTDNHTGMNGATTLTQTGPGSDGNGYVRWITVTAGQFYYIAIDRPEGNGGFEIQWTGTATAGTGAFAPPPIANEIPDYNTCSNTPDIGIFDLNTVRSQINPDLTTNTITFHATLADANDNVSPLPNIIGNTTNPQLIYTRVTNNITGCYSISDFNLAVYLVPDASLTVSDQEICSGEDTTVTFSGTSGATVEYTINGESIQSSILDASGIFTITETLTANRTYSLVSVKIVDAGGNTICSQLISNSVTITVNPLPIVTITGPGSICPEDVVTIMLSGTPNALVNYSFNGDGNQTITLDTTGNASISNGTIGTYTLVSVTATGLTTCSQNLNQSITITANPSPTVTITASPICSGSAATITFNGTPNATIAYSVDGSPNEFITLNGTGNATLLTPALTSNSTYTLVSATSAGTPGCTQSQTGSATVTILPSPTATISGTTTICSGNTAAINFNGTPNATITYQVNGGINQMIILDGTGNASVNTPLLIADSIYTLVSITSAGTSACTQVQTGSVIITVIALPNAAISGAATICVGTSTTINFTGTSNATVTYFVNNGPNQTIALNSSGTAMVSTGILTADTTYTLVSVTSTGTPSCSQILTGSITVVMVSMPTITVTPASQEICSGDLAEILFASNDPNTTFSWTVSQTGVFGTMSGSGNAISQALTTIGTTQGTATYTIIPTANGCNGLPITAIVKVNPTPEVFGPTSNIIICSGDSSNVMLSPNIPGTTFSWTVAQTGAMGASNGTGNLIAQNLDTTGNTPGTVVYTVTPKLGLCSGTPINITVIVNPLPVPTIADGVICVNQSTGVAFQTTTLDTELNNANHDFVWYFEGNTIPGATANTYVTTQAGNYGVKATNNTTGCISMTETAEVIASFPGLTITTTQTLAFSDNGTITVNIEGGNGIYEYQLDGESFQFSNVFNDVSPGPHTVSVRDTNGCTDLSTDVSVIGYPNYFTPNGDGIHDTWNLIGLENEPSTKIYIYDRYGKLLKQINPTGAGWDGMYNQQILPSTDYWFTVTYLEGGVEKVFKSHFSMKR